MILNVTAIGESVANRMVGEFDAKAQHYITVTDFEPLFEKTFYAFVGQKLLPEKLFDLLYEKVIASTPVQFALDTMNSIVEEMRRDFDESTRPDGTFDAMKHYGLKASDFV